MKVTLECGHIKELSDSFWRWNYFNNMPQIKSKWTDYRWMTVSTFRCRYCGEVEFDSEDFPRGPSRRVVGVDTTTRQFSKREAFMALYMHSEAPAFIEGIRSGRFNSDDADKETAMSRTSNAADVYRRRAEELELKAEAIESFGCDEAFPISSVLYFERQFELDRGYRINRRYKYTAVKVGDNSWYVTGMNSRSWTWERLVEEHLVKAREETGEVWFATKWEALG